MSAISKISIRHAALSNRIVLARFGKDPKVALETRDAMPEFLQAITSYACDGKMPEVGAGGSFQFGAKDEQFIVTVRRVTQDEADAFNADPRSEAS